MRPVMKAAKGMSRIDRCVGATMYAPSFGTRSFPTTRTRKTTRNRLRTMPRANW